MWPRQPMVWRLCVHTSGTREHIFKVYIIISVSVGVLFVRHSQSHSIMTSEFCVALSSGGGGLTNGILVCWLQDCNREILFRVGVLPKYH